MKTNYFIKRICMTLLFTLLLGKSYINAESTVYFFVDFRFWISEYPFTVDGENAFSLIPEGKPLVKDGAVMYNNVMRKVIFEHPGTYVISTGYLYDGVSRDVTLNLNVENDETYYVLINSSLKKPFYIEQLDEKKGLKLLNKATKDKKYTINEEFIYKGN